MEVLYQQYSRALNKATTLHIKNAKLHRLYTSDRNFIVICTQSLPSGENCDLKQQKDSFRFQIGNVPPNHSQDIDLCTELAMYLQNQHIP